MPTGGVDAALNVDVERSLRRDQAQTVGRATSRSQDACRRLHDASTPLVDDRGRPFDGDEHNIPRFGVAHLRHDTLDLETIHAPRTDRAQAPHLVSTDDVDERASRRRGDRVRHAVAPTHTRPRADDVSPGLGRPGGNQPRGDEVDLGRQRRAGAALVTPRLGKHLTAVTRLAHAGRNDERRLVEQVVRRAMTRPQERVRCAITRAGGGDIRSKGIALTGV